MLLIGVFTFAAPALLLGASAAVLPVVIHFLLRPKARRVRFPPVTFLADALASGQRAQRVRDGWLLTLRALLVGVVAALLAGPTCSQPRSADVIDGPVAAALVVDGSWSTRYGIDAETQIVDQLAAAADAVAAGATSWPQPSTLSLFGNSPDALPLEPTGDFASVRDGLKKIADETPHAATLARSLRDASRTLATSRQPLRKLYIFTDLAAHAWRDVPVGLLASIDNVMVRVISPLAERRSNVGISSAVGPATVHPESAAVPIAVTITAGGIDASATVLAIGEGRELARAGPLRLAAGGSDEIVLNLPPTPRGTHGVELRVEPRDRLPFDQSRFVTWQTGDRPRAWLIAPGDRLDADLSTTIYRNLLAPESLEAPKQLIEFEWLDASAIAGRAGAPDGTASSRPNLILVLPAAEIVDATRQFLLKQVEDGAILLLAVGSSERTIDWPGLRRVFSSQAPMVEMLDAPSPIIWERDSDFARAKDGPDEFARMAVRRQLKLGELADGVLVQAHFTDGSPAVLSKRHGRGEVYLLATSPDPTWSDIGIRAGGLLSWIHALIARTSESADATRSITIGEPLRPPLPWPAGRGLPGAQNEIAGLPLTVPLKVTDGRIDAFPARVPGVYALRSTDGPPLRIAANWPADESDLRPITLDELKKLLGADRVQIDDGSGVAESPAGRRWFAGPLDPLTWWPLLLIAVVVTEMWLASRAK